MTKKANRQLRKARQELKKLKVNPAVADRLPRVEGTQPVAMALMQTQEFTAMPDSKAVDVVSALFTEVLGRLDAMNQGLVMQAEDMAGLKERLTTREQAEERWAKDRQGFMDELRAKTEAIPPEQRERARARAAQELEQTRSKIAATMATDRMSLKQKLAAEPQIEIMRPGKYSLISGPGGPQVQVEAERYVINGMAFFIEPNKRVLVPQSLAEQIEQSDASLRETEARKGLLTSVLESPKLSQQWNALDKQYHTHTSEHEAGSPTGLPTAPAM